MSLEELRKKRLKWVEANRENGFEDGIKHLLADLYPDNAHFIYELLQNAEDAKATEVRFILKEDGVEFEHNGGRLFSDEDVEAITSIGISTKKDDPTNIGKFGVGFKAVFAYTETPEVASGEFHFRIRDLVVPDTNGLAHCDLGEKETRFSFPFNNPEKAREKARDEIERNLRRLNESTLLFLNNIRKIEYLLPDSPPGFLERRETDGNRIKILIEHPEDSEETSVFFLRFEKEVVVNDEDDKPKSCRIAIAFGLEKPEGQGWEIRALNRGQVCIYFPAEKERSNLRFHLHAPFASTVARDSVRDSDANEDLCGHLANLTTESMIAIRDQGLLDVGFLAVLPNERDNIPAFYRPIQERLIEAFKSESLTPMKRGGHAPAAGVYRGRRQLSDLIKDEDLATILGEDRSLPLWVANPSQRNQREDNFLSMLDISTWAFENLVDALPGESEPIPGWLSEKLDEWHQRLYALLSEDLGEENDLWWKVKSLRIVRLSNGDFSKGKDCFFPTEETEDDPNFPRVAEGVYSSGSNKRQKDRSRKFLEEIGVRKVGERERIEAILKQRYTKEAEIPTDAVYWKDLKRFILFLVEHPTETALVIFWNYLIFKLVDDRRGRPCQVYLDSPFDDTGLSAYYEVLGDEAKRWPLSQNYEESEIKLLDIGEFAKRVGVQTELCPKKQFIPLEHPEWSKLRDSGRWTKNGIDKDYDIREFDELLAEPNSRKSKLVWNTMNELSDDCLKAKYRSNSWQSIKTASSTLVHKLRKKDWVPQKQNDQEEYAFLKPVDAVVELLPDGFKLKTGAEWLEATEFGKNRREREEQEHSEKEQETQEYRQKAEREQIAAESLGTDKEGFERVKEFSALSPEEQKRLLDESKQQSSSKFPEREPTNSERRGERVAEQAEDAPDRIFVKRPRSVSVEREAVKSETEPYLRNLYTENDELFCQICHQPMPFKLSDGKHYFEMVEFLELNKRHYENYLALCPNHAAMYRHANDSKNSVLDSFKNLEPEQLKMALTLAKQGVAIEFTKTHIEDLRVVIDVEESSQQHDT